MRYKRTVVATARNAQFEFCAVPNVGDLRKRKNEVQEDLRYRLLV